MDAWFIMMPNADGRPEICLDEKTNEPRVFLNIEAATEALKDYPYDEPYLALVYYDYDDNLAKYITQL